MSYILDALRRAEAQRSRGRPPGLHEASAGTIPAGQPTFAPRRWLALGLLLVLLLIGLSAIGVALLRQPVAATDSSAGAAPVAPEPANASAAVAVAAVGMPAASATAAPAPSLALPRKAVLAEPPTAPAAPAAAATLAERQGAKAAGEGGLEQAGVSAAAAAKPAGTDERNSVAAASPAPRTTAVLPTRQELPADIRRRLPSIVVSGTVYSSDPAQRMLVVNGELWREGDQVGPELVLEQIRRRDAVLRFRDQRFTVSP